MRLSVFAATVAVALPLAMAGAAKADTTSATLELGYTRVQTHDTQPDFHFDTVEIRGGYQFAKNWGAEMEGGFGVGDDKLSVQGFGINVRQDWEVGLFGVGYLPVGHNIDLYGRAGYSRIQITASTGGIHIAGQGNGAAAGVGVRQFPGGGKNGWRLDYTHQFYQDSSSADTFSAAYVRRF